MFGGRAWFLTPSLKEPAFSNIRNNYKPVRVINTSINPYSLDIPYLMTLASHTLDCYDQPVISKITIKTYDDRVLEDDIRKITEQITRILVRLIDQPKIKYQLGLYCRFGKKYRIYGILKEKIITLGWNSNILKLKWNLYHHFMKKTVNLKQELKTQKE